MTNPVYRPSKRRKVEHDEVLNNQVKSVDDLHYLLSFQQSTDTFVKDGVNAFKDFLTTLTKEDSTAARSENLRILRQYCNQQASTSTDQVDFPDLLSTWSFAAQHESDLILSAVPAALAQFFRTISGILEFREFGLSLVHSLLKRDQVRLLDRGLSSPKSKSHLISPCLRLLTELVNFDAGALASNVWGKRDILLKRFDSLLHQQHTSSNVEERRQPSVRRMALRLLRAILKFGDTGVKTELLTQGRALHSALQGLIHDGDDIAIELLHDLEKDLVDDPAIPKLAKARFFTTANLFSLTALYEFEVDDQEAIDRVREAAHSLLVKLCSTRKGILISNTGWYPAETSPYLNIEAENDLIDLGLDSPTYFDDYSKNVPVKNGVLATILPRLSVAKDPLQNVLLLEILQAAPELVAYYITKRPKFSTLPKDDEEWRGEFASFFSIIQLAIPHSLGFSGDNPKHPPPLSIVIESVLPRPFDRSLVSKLFSSKDNVLILSGARLMTVAINKLQDVLDAFAIYQESNQFLWRQASERLVKLFVSRAVPAKEVITALQHGLANDISLHMVLLECLKTYFQLLPEATSASKFDVSPVMLNLVADLENTADARNSSLIQSLSYCVAIADLSPATKWFQKSDNDTLSLFGRLLRLSVSDSSVNIVRDISFVLKEVIERKRLINQTTATFDALLSSLKSDKKFVPSFEVFLFLDNSIARTNQRPVKYLDTIELLQKLLSDKKAVSLVAASVAEQWEFALKKYVADKNTLKNIAAWVARFYSVLDAAGENFRVLNHLQDQMIEVAGEKAKGYMQKGLDRTRKKPIILDDQATSKIHADERLGTNQQQPKVNGIIGTLTKYSNLPLLFGISAPSPISLEGLDRWSLKTDFWFEVQTGRFQRLIECVSSSEEEIRRQAFQILQRISHLLDPSSQINNSDATTTTDNTSRASKNAQPDVPETLQLHLLIGEVLETVRHHNAAITSPFSEPVPSIVPALCYSILVILQDPSHLLYGKISRFLLRSPHWDVRKLISNWVDKIMFKEPENSNDHITVSMPLPSSYTTGADTPSAAASTTTPSIVEATWLLNFLVSSLRTQADLDLFRRSNVFERLLSLYAAPLLSRGGSGKQLKLLILNLLYRALVTEGNTGADTLWTRFGVHSWLTLQRDAMEKDADLVVVVTTLLGEMETRCDKAGIEAWKVRTKAMASNDGQKGLAVEGDQPQQQTVA